MPVHTARFRPCRKIFSARACLRIERLALAFLCAVVIKIRADLHANGSEFFKSHSLIAGDHARLAGAINIDDTGTAKRAQIISDRRT